MFQLFIHGWTFSTPFIVLILLKHDDKILIKAASNKKFDNFFVAAKIPGAWSEVNNISRLSTKSRSYTNRGSFVMNVTNPYILDPTTQLTISCIRTQKDVTPHIIFYSVCGFSQFVDKSCKPKPRSQVRIVD